MTLDTHSVLASALVGLYACGGATMPPTPEGSTPRAIVKGGSWDDSGCGICRPAARHSRPLALKHILIGFRLVREAS